VRPRRTSWQSDSRVLPPHRKQHSPAHACRGRALLGLDDEQVRNLTVLLFEEEGSLLPDEKGPDATFRRAHCPWEELSEAAYWELQSGPFLPICRDFDGASRTRTGDLLGAIRACAALE
jgi:hypothetical protein